MKGNTNAKRGSYFKNRTRKYLQDHGWTVADMEIIKYAWTPKGRLPIKRDQWASDLIAFKGEITALIQVKGGAQAVGNGTFPAARKAFAAFQFPSYFLLLILAWAPRSRKPRIVKVT